MLVIVSVSIDDRFFNREIDLPITSLTELHLTVGKEVEVFQVHSIMWLEKERQTIVDCVSPCEDQPRLTDRLVKRFEKDRRWKEVENWVK